MATYSQEDRTFRVDTDLGKDVLLLDGFSGQEGVSRPFQFTLELLSKDSAVDPHAILRSAVVVTVTLGSGETRVIHGRVNRFTQGARSEDLTSYEAEIVPWLWFLSLSTDCRIFQEKSVPEIIETIFGEYPDAAFENKCVGSYPPREYCVQYRESDLSFVSRLMEEEGIFYFFQHSDSAHTLILADDPNAVEDSAQSRARVLASPDEEEREEVILELRREHAVHPTAVVLTDYDHLHPSLDLRSSAKAEDHEEVYDFPGKYSEVSDGERYASLLLEERSALQEVVRGSSTCRGFESGHKFALQDYYRKDANQSYLLLTVQHRAGGGGYRTGHADTHYQNQFTCIPVSVPYRPPRVSRKPVIQGSQTAVVVGPSGEEIYADQHGRVKLHFHWDREGRRDDKSSCWVRVSHPWAGKGWGAVALPRMGQEVIVDFLEGDPDRPIITGRVYNAEQVPPYSLPANKTQTGMKSRSSAGGGVANFNEIRMEDKKGEELLYIHAEKNRSVVVEADNTESVGHDESVSVGNNQTENIGKDQSLTVGENQTITVGKNRSETVASNHAESIGEDMSVTVGKDRSVTVGGDQSESVGDSSSLTVGNDRGETIGGKLTLAISKDVSVAVGGKQTVDIAKESSHAAKTIQIRGDDEISIVTGSASILMKKDGSITIKGKKINVQASGDVVIKGTKVAQN